jgi:hypothetical protein
VKKKPKYFLKKITDQNGKFSNKNDFGSRHWFRLLVSASSNRQSSAESAATGSELFVSVLRYRTFYAH